MKSFIKSFIYTIILLVSFTGLMSSQTTEILFKDTVGNSQTKVFTADVDPTVDSVVLGIYWKGAIDVDSLDVKFIQDRTIRFRQANVTVVDTTTSYTDYSKKFATTTEVDLDSAVARYDSVVTTIPRSAFGTYNKIQFTLISSSSGNDKTDVGQKAVAILHRFYHYKP